MTEKVYVKLPGNTDCVLQITNDEKYINIVEVEDNIIIYDSRINPLMIQKWSKIDMIEIKEDEFNEKYFKIRRKN